ncbi:restriction endonuclease subunit S [Microvirga arsenatis]|uniref:Restriction endonuclease subunit S n=1 Tax=Microvirga arsenatis TaxID=2692265 RepID=A0ABW9Z0L6_9HYPH|nr:restriction endonuclease subunit S [Microvirga arsenatis]NBJ12571.1 restriction endonuclease subunit S [Microvirga arsenatis]NBJ26191.1 restriction endonuclease subunit S [Microvirga arsenatis]
MSFPQYSTYRSSRLEWLGKVPSHWGEAHLKWLARRYAGGTPDKTRSNFWTDGTIPWLNSGSVNQGVITEPSAYITEEALEKSSARWVPSGALVMALAGQGKTKGMVAQMAITATCNQSMAAIVPTPEIAARYLFWWLTNNYQNIRNLAGGDLRDGLNLELLGEIPCPIPSLDEQTCIATFLDRETAKIDVLIEEQQQLIELLKEKQQAVISHAVTQGLNRGVPTKTTGLEWPDTIPKHWEILPLTRLVRQFVDYRGATPTKVEDGVPLITATQIKDGRIDHSLDPVFISEAEYLSRMTRGFPERGDVLLTTEAPLGEVAQIENERVAPGQRMILMKVESRKITNTFLYTHFRSLFGKMQLWARASGSTASGIRSDRLRASLVLVPPIEEQEEIVSHIAKETAGFGQIEKEAEAAIALLRERRNALISAAVTGKIDVRGLAPAKAEAA